MKNEHDANLTLQPIEQRRIEPRAIEHYARPVEGAWTLFRWSLGVMLTSALLGFVTGLLWRYL